MPWAPPRVRSPRRPQHRPTISHCLSVNSQHPPVDPHGEFQSTPGIPLPHAQRVHEASRLNVRGLVEQRLSQTPNVYLLEPLG